MRVKLGEYIKIMHGYAFKTENYVDYGEYRLVTLGNFQEGGNCFKYNDTKATYYGADFPNKFILSEGDLILPLTEQVIGLFGNSAFVPKENRFKFVLNQRVGKVEIIKEGLDIYYLHYLLATSSVKHQLEARASGTKQRNISPDDVYDVIVDLPDYEIQKQTGKILYQIELKQENNSKIIAELESMAKTLYDYWFLQFEFSNEEGKPYKSSGGKMVYNEEFKREIPEGWTLKHAVDIAEIKTGKEDANHSTENGQYPFFTCSNDILKCDDYKFDSNSILIAGNGDFNVKHYKGKFNAYQRTYVITPFNEKYIGLFELCCNQTIERFKKGSNGSIVKFITLGDIQNIQMLDSGHDDLLKPFNYVLEKIDIIKKENQELASLRDFLLPMLMNGQVTFK